MLSNTLHLFIFIVILIFSRAESHCFSFSATPPTVMILNIVNISKLNHFLDLEAEGEIAFHACSRTFHVVMWLET